jgi:hypothetical protein
MSEAQIIYWRDIPTQIVAGKGRKAKKRALPPRFLVAVDKAAMKSGASDTDAYLEEWRKAPVELDGDDLEAAIEALAEKIETEYPAKRLAELAERGGSEA